MMKKIEQLNYILEVFEKNSPRPETELHYTDPYQLLVAVILSAQCTDKRVNMLTPAFFKQFPNYNYLANATVAEIYELIKSCSYPNNKAKNLLGMAQTLRDTFDGKVPKTVDELQKLPGVGRKTANVVASVAFGVPTMPVDTHVFRVANRIGLVKNAKTPFDVETALVKLCPREKLHDLHHWLILHGRYTCKARKPLCADCPIIPYCNYLDKTV